MKQLKKEISKLSKYIEIIDEFVDNNYCADGCRECHEVGHNLVPQDDTKSKKAILKLASIIYNDGYCDGIDDTKQVLNNLSIKKGDDEE